MPKKAFTMGASTIPGEFIIPGLLSRMLKELPDLELKVDVSDSLKVFERVEKGDLEVGIIGTRYDSPKVDYLTIVKDDRLVFISPKGHPLAGRKAVQTADLKGQGFINREPGSGTRESYERALRDAGITIEEMNVVAEISDTEGIIQAVENGAGISVVSELAAKEAIELGKVVVLDMPQLEMTRDFHIIARKGEELSLEAGRVVSAIKGLLT
jgi:DNA-binding transcriptional LysR family regulator